MAQFDLLGDALVATVGLREDASTASIQSDTLLLQVQQHDVDHRSSHTAPKRVKPKDANQMYKGMLLKTVKGLDERSSWPVKEAKDLGGTDEHKISIMDC